MDVRTCLVEASDQAELGSFFPVLLGFLRDTIVESQFIAFFWRDLVGEIALWV